MNDATTATQKDGAIREAPGKASRSLHPDEIVAIEPPGGGGWDGA
jgi:N-methylhydantoinase B/oxoprolinase/acetone carboxylase alpha subunit